MGNCTDICKRMSFFFAKNARFTVCHSGFMDEKTLLVTLRNDLFNTKTGKLLIDYLQDFLTSEACLNRNGDEIRGMARVIEEIKKIPGKVNNK